MAKTGPKAKLSAADAVHIREMSAQGRSDSAIARDLGVSRSTVLRARHSPSAANVAPSATGAESAEALAEYKHLAMDAYARAMHGEGVTYEIAFLRSAENALTDNGIAQSDGTPWRFSVLAHLAQRAAQHR